ncbi:MAG: DUF2461 domain-containing protein [Lachnospiraceae bacterium]|nr:DUF2461 domain-containing protein [Lachnospiraceae bacterium]
MKTELILHYLEELSANNEREWYHAHKAEYKEANAEFEGLIQELILGIGAFDKSVLPWEPKQLTFKLVRDTRFSHDKSPYNPAFRAHISSQGKLPIPVGYYVMIKPGGQSFLGGGLFADMFKDATKMVRDYIQANPEEWKAVIEEEEFRRHFQVQGTALKKVPQGYEKENPQAEFLKYKSWYLEYPVEDEIIKNADDFQKLAVSVFQKMKPFNDYLNRALAGFQMPER